MQSTQVGENSSMHRHAEATYWGDFKLEASEENIASDCIQQFYVDLDLEFQLLNGRTS